MPRLKIIDGIFGEKNEKIIFYSVLIINIAFLFVTKFYPSMDGPAHLYNSNLIKQIILKNQFVESYLQINAIPVPNWSSHFILSLFQLFLPSWLAEKVLLILYVSGMAISFRYLIRTIKRENIGLSVFIFPFIYSFLFRLGFYNFSLSFIFFFLTLSFWINYYKSNNLILYLGTGVLLLCTFFSNILTYAFLGLTLGCVTLYFELGLIKFDIRQLISTSQKRLLYLFACALPSLVFLYIFFWKVTFPSSTQTNDITELVKWINDVRPLIVYGYQGEANYTGQIFHVLLFVLLFSLVLNDRKASQIDKPTIPQQILLWFPIGLTLILLFILPNDSSAGMMSDRLCLLFFIYLIIVAASRNLPAKIILIVSIIIVVLHLSLLIKHTITIRNLDKDAVLISESAKYIDDNSTVLTVCLSDNWLEPHFSNYLGNEKSLILLENYEVEVGWFPLVWNKNSPNIQLCGKNSINGLNWHQNLQAFSQQQIDYVFFYGNMSKRNDINWEGLNAVIASEFTLKYESQNKYIQLYEKRNKTKDSK